MSLKWGVDASIAITPARMQAEQASFVCRYLCPNGQSKQCSVSEVQNLVKAGYEVVFVWESDGLPGNGYDTGRAAAVQASQQAAERGFPDAPIYFAFADTASPNLKLVGEATQGAASIVGLGRTGGYGGINTIKYLFDNGLITYGWQTYAWSNGQWDSRAQLRQWKNTPSIDYDAAEYPDFGQVPRLGLGGNMSQADDFVNKLMSDLIGLLGPNEEPNHHTLTYSELLAYLDKNASDAANRTKDILAIVHAVLDRVSAPPAPVPVTVDLDALAAKVAGLLDYKAIATAVNDDVERRMAG